MGGLEVTAEAEVISKSGVIPGLYAAGEIAGGRGTLTHRMYSLACTSIPIVLPTCARGRSFGLKAMNILFAYHKRVLSSDKA